MNNREKLNSSGNKNFFLSEKAKSLSEKIYFLEYDTNLFGYRVGKIPGKLLDSLEEFKRLEEEARKEKFKLLYIQFETEEHFSKFKNFIEERRLFIDRKIVFCKELILSDYKDNDVKIYNFLEVSPKLLYLALESGKYSRFRLDRNFVNNEFEKLYTDWIKKCVNRELADYVLVYYSDNEIVGFLALSLSSVDKDSAKIVLVSVDKNFRNQGIGRKLIEKAEFLSWTAGKKYIIVSTQEKNSEALNFYRRVGFESCKLEITIHLWI